MIEQRSPEWFAARKGRLTGSIAGACLDLAPYMTKDAAFRVLVRSMHDMPDEFQGNIATEYGANNEDGAVLDYELETGRSVTPAPFVPWNNWLGASPDGYVGDDGLIEAKCPFGLRKDENPQFKSIADQPHYYAQVQVQLFVTGRSWCDFWQWSPHGTNLERVTYDGAWIDDNIPTLLAFWQDAKAADPADYEGLVRPTIDTPEALRLVQEYDDLKDAIDNATERKKEILAEIVRIANGKNAEVAGRKLTLTIRKGSIAYAKALNAAAPDFDVEPYRGKGSESWGLK